MKLAGNGAIVTRAFSSKSTHLVDTPDRLSFPICLLMPVDLLMWEHIDLQNDLVFLFLLIIQV
jgi:hypothetical protein